MTRDDIIRLGEQADEVADRKIKMRGEFHPDWHEVRDQKFAALVAAAEREACAKVCEIVWDSRAGLETGTAFECAAAIRARGES